KAEIGEGGLQGLEESIRHEGIPLGVRVQVTRTQRCPLDMAGALRAKAILDVHEGDVVELRRAGPHDGCNRRWGSNPVSVQLPGFHKGLASDRRVARREAALSALVSLAGGGLLAEGRLIGQIRGDGRQENGDAGTLEGAKGIPQIGLELSYAGLKDVVPS